MMGFDSGQLAALTVAVSFAAGLNVYATAVTLGLLARAGVVALPAPIGVLEDPWVLSVCGVLFVAEFIADKIPVFDLVWNALQTFVRVPAGALLAWSAASTLSPGAQALAALAGGAIALAAHAGKLALRSAVTGSPEPLSNAALSFTEDIVAIGLTWFATTHPYLAGAFTLASLAVIVLLVRWVVRAFGRLWRTGESRSPGLAGIPLQV